jgi:hypothetical protein
MMESVFEKYLVLNDVVRLLAMRQRRDVLVVGCHDPAPSLALAEQGASITLVDPYRQNIVYCEGVLLGQRTSFQHHISNYDRLPVPDHSAEAVLAFAPFHDASLVQARYILSECTRALRISGAFAAFFRAPKLGRQSTDRRGGQAHAFEEEELRQFLSGLRIRYLARARLSDRHRQLHNDHGHWEVLGIREK